MQLIKYNSLIYWIIFISSEEVSSIDENNISHNEQAKVKIRESQCNAIELIKYEAPISDSKWVVWLSKATNPKNLIMVCGLWKVSVHQKWYKKGFT